MTPHVTFAKVEPIMKEGEVRIRIGVRLMRPGVHFGYLPHNLNHNHTPPYQCVRN